MDSKEPHKLLKMALILAVLSCLWGCGSKTADLGKDEELKPSEMLIADPDRRLADVPTPLGAKFEANSSRNYQSGSRRRVDHKYSIWAKESQLRLFFRDNMPIHGWELTNSIVGPGTYNINYKKGRESCRVSIGPKNWCFQTQIKITVQPVKDFY